MEGFGDLESALEKVDQRLMNDSTFEDRLSDLKLISRTEKTVDGFFEVAKQLIADVLIGRFSSKAAIRQQTEERLQRISVLVMTQILWSLRIIAKGDNCGIEETLTRVMNEGSEACNYLAGFTKETVNG